ncbi:MAG: hypothetical protein NZ900_03155 [Synergistetes bacterium]|nr:hypothetical protein [Synergistota bacterium]MDW8191929.1 HlyD family efflux transporter periplasmic adaptor subunit [Synergistota bacterium]
MRKVIVILFSVIIVISACIFYFRVESASQPPKISTLSVKLEKMEEFIEAKAFVFCEGSLLVSPSSGKVTWLKKDGERVKKGSIVAKVGDRDVLAGESGILLYGVDDLSGIWKLEDAWERGIINIPSGKIRLIEDGSIVKAGSPIGEIRDNLFINLFLRVKKEDFDARWLEKRKISLVFPSFKREVLSKLVDIKVVEGDLFVILSLVGWDELVRLRSVDVRLIKRKLTGAVIPINAIIIKDGKSGVYMVKGGRVFFKEIKFKELSSALAITSDLKDGDRIVVEPDKVSEGAFVRW